ncbi:MAG: GAF and ANTAR domain-containing protein [Pseudarthrobacter sp.]
MAAETPRGPGWESLPDPQELVFESTDVEDFLAAVTGEFIRDLDGDVRLISWAVTFFRPGAARTAAAGSAAARAADEEQCSFADGHVAETASDRRWPGYASVASDHGVRSLLSVPIVSGAGWHAALSLYAATPHAFSSQDIVMARRYARQMARSLRLVVQVAARAEAGAQLAIAQSSAVLMDLAVGILMADYGLGHEAALQYLRTVARHTGQGLRQTALNIVAASRPEAAEPRQDNASFGLIAVETPALNEGPYKTGSTP